MNVINKITLENLKKNKKRTIVTIIGVILSTALICAVAGMCMSFKQSMINFTIADDGNYHLYYEDVPQKELKYIEQNVNVEKYFYTQNIGVAKLEGSKNKYKPYVNIVAMSEDALNSTGLNLIDGRLPENENEILVSDSIENNARVTYKNGDTVKLNVGTRVDENGNKLSQNVAINLSDEDLEDNETKENQGTVTERIINTTEKEYKVVGIVKRVNYVIEPYSAPAYTIITKLNDSNLNLADKEYNVFIRVTVPKEFYKVNDNILQTLKNDTGKDFEFEKNNTLLEFEGALSENTMRAIYGLAAIIIGIIVVSSVFVIRNSFSISITEKIKEFGMLSSVGATSRQIRKSVIFEGFVIALIGIPLGILLGVLAGVILIQVINVILNEDISDLGVKFVYSIPLIAILISAVLGEITIFLSSLVPAIKASRISTIEAIRGNNSIKIKNKKLKTSKIIKKLFGVGGDIASKSLKRSKKKYRTTVISLVVSIVVFIALSTFIQYGFSVSGMQFKDLDYNIFVDSSDENCYNELKNNPLVSDYSQYKQAEVLLDINKYGSDYSKKLAKKLEESYEDSQSVEGIYQIVVFVNRDYFKNFLQSNGIDTSKMNEIAILEDDTVSRDEKGKQKIERFLNLNQGETINVKAYNGNDYTDEISIKVTNIITKRPRGFEMVSNVDYGGYIFVSEDYYQKDKFKVVDQTDMYIKTDFADELERQLTDLKSKDDRFSDLVVENIDDYAKTMDRMVLIVSIFLYGFIIVITLIGVTNVFNTITTNMLLRRKEFAMLKSIGMTSKEFNRMIELESLMYGLKSLVIGIPLGIIVSYQIYKVLANQIDVGFLLPIKAIIICCIFIFIIVAITMKYSIKQINKQNIVETIRNDNI